VDPVWYDVASAELWIFAALAAWPAWPLALMLGYGAWYLHRRAVIHEQEERRRST
jgi:hypothetical protein